MTRAELVELLARHVSWSDCLAASNVEQEIAVVLDALYRAKLTVVPWQPTDDMQEILAACCQTSDEDHCQRVWYAMTAVAGVELHTDDTVREVLAAGAVKLEET